MWPGPHSNPYKNPLVRRLASTRSALRSGILNLSTPQFQSEHYCQSWGSMPVRLPARKSCKRPLSQAIKDDYTEGNVVEVEQYLLSRTEALFVRYALEMQGLVGIAYTQPTADNSRWPHRQ